MRFAPEGRPIVFTVGIATLVANLLGWWWLGLAGLVFTLAVAAFFRDPERAVAEGDDLVVSPADGRVVAIDGDRTPASAPPGQRFQRVAIFMSPLDVHVNRVPVSGRVLSVRHTPGRFRAAFSDHASDQNERNEVTLRDPAGRLLVFVQIAGMLARRIVCHLESGQTVEQGSRFGLIMFGSRVDVYLPESATVTVRVGDRVRAGTHVLGKMSS